MPVATRSGQQLKERLNAGGAVAKQIHDHEQMAQARHLPDDRPVAARGRAAVAGPQRDGSKRATTVVAVLGVVAALAAAAQVTIAGHLGSTAVWKCTIGACQ